MGASHVITALRLLSRGTRHRSETARLRDLFDALEAARTAGVRRAALLQVLHDEGFTLTLESFAQVLYRLRKERARASLSSRPLPSPDPKNFPTERKRP